MIIALWQHERRNSMNYMEIPVQAEKILDVLHGAGYEAFVVGGCVRDSVLGRTPGDWDITTSASPQEIKGLFARTIDTGIAHGTVTVMINGEGYEVTTYRIDGVYEDSRHPKDVTFTSSLHEDLRRRDFTINAMAYSHETGIVDIFGGMKDLQDKVIRCVGNARERFSEDALRMLRAVRFAGQLGFSIDESVRDAIRGMADSLDHISVERIREEIVKLLISPHPSWFRLAYETGITSVIMPEFDRLMVQSQNNPHHSYTTGEHTLLAMESIPASAVLRLAMLFHDIGKPDVCVTDENGRDHFHGHAARSEEITYRIMKRLKFDNVTLSRVCNLVKNHSLYPQLSAKDIRFAAFGMGPDMFDDYLLVKRADILSQNPDVIQSKLNYLEEVSRIWNEIKLQGDCLSMKQLSLKGTDLISDGMKPGPELGRLLERLLFEVLEHPHLNTKDYLLEKSRQLRNQTETQT